MNAIRILSATAAFAVIAASTSTAAAAAAAATGRRPAHGRRLDLGHPASGAPVPRRRAPSRLDRTVAQSTVGKAFVARMQQLQAQAEAELTPERTRAADRRQHPARSARQPGARGVPAARRSPERPHPGL